MLLDCWMQIIYLPKLRMSSVPFGGERRYQVNKNGRTYAVEEQQFALFPQKSGDLKIKPPVFNALVYDFAC